MTPEPSTPPMGGTVFMALLADTLEGDGLPAAFRWVGEEATPHLVVQVAVDRWVDVARDPYAQMAVKETPGPDSDLLGTMYAHSLRTMEETVAAVRAQVDGEPVGWSVMSGTSPDAAAVEPARAGVDIPADVLTWAESHGVAVDNPDMYVLVGPLGEPDIRDGEVAFRRGMLPAGDVARIRAGLDEA